MQASQIFRRLVKGDQPGHPFRGNQYETGAGGGSFQNSWKSPRPGVVMNTDKEGNTYIIEGDRWLVGGEKVEQGDYRSMFSVTVKNSAGKAVAGCLARYSSGNAGHAGFTSPTVNIQHIETYERGKGYATKIVEAIHEAVAPTGEKPTILHSGFTGDLGRNFANSLDPSYNKVKDDGETEYHDPLNFKGAITKGDFEGHPFRGNQYEEGQGGESHWKPVMTKAEAKQWVKDSGGRFTLPFYHGTSTMSAALIGQSGLRTTETGSAGSGIYLTDSQNVAGRYADEQQRQDAGLQEGTWEHNSAKGDILSVYTNVKNVADTEQSSLIIGRATTPPPFTNEPYPEYQAKLDKWKATDVGESIKQQAISEGFDAMMYRPPVLGDAQVGATYLVVFDPKNVVVVGNEVKKGDVQGHPFHGNQYEDGQGGGSPHLSFIANKASKFYASGGTVTVYTRQGQEVGEVFGEMKKLQAERDRIAEQPGFTTKNMEWRRLAEVTGAHERAGHYGNDLLVARNAGGEIVAAMDVRYVGGTLYIGVVGALEGSNGAGTALELEAARYITSKVENSSKRDGGIESTTEFGSEGYHQALGRNFMQWQSARNPSNPAEGKWVPTDTPKEGNKSFWTPEQVKEIASLDVASKVITKGDIKGHVFHGNQWIDGEGNFVGSGRNAAATPPQPPSEPPHDEVANGHLGNFRGFTAGNQIAHKLQTFDVGSGNQQIKMETVAMEGGGIGIMKQMEDWDSTITASICANREVIASTIGKICNFPIREAAAIPGHPDSIVQAFVDGITQKDVAQDAKGGGNTDPLEPSDIKDWPPLARQQYSECRFFDVMIGNYDRHWGNYMITNTQDNPTWGKDFGASGTMTPNSEIVGIDHSLAFIAFPPDPYALMAEQRRWGISDERVGGIMNSLDAAANSGTLGRADGLVIDVIRGKMEAAFGQTAKR